MHEGETDFDRRFLTEENQGQRRLIFTADFAIFRRWEKDRRDERDLREDKFFWGRTRGWQPFEKVESLLLRVESHREDMWGELLAALVHAKG